MARSSPRIARKARHSSPETGCRRGLLTWLAMIRSMSGHGLGEASSERLRVSAEVRTVNNRFCRISLRLPSELGFFEDEARRRIQQRVQRGKVDVALTVEGASSATMRVDRDAALLWMEELRALGEAVGGNEAPSMRDVLWLPGVLVTDGAARVDPEADVELLRQALAAALDSLGAMREREGQDLAADLTARVEIVAVGLERIATAARELPVRARDQLRQRIEELLADTGHPVDEDRLLQEAAYYAERADITEEVVRLSSHLDKMRALLDADEAVGRTLEFVTQEIHRELNTIGAKTKDLAVADTVVELKSELERIREQVQNIE